MKDLYRGDGGPLNDYDQGWNDGVEAAEKALRAENAAIKAAQPSGYIIEEVSSGGYSVGGAGGSGPSAISDERILEILKSVDPKAVRLPTGWREFAHALIAAAQEGK